MGRARPVHRRLPLGADPPGMSASSAKPASRGQVVGRRDVTLDRDEGFVAAGQRRHGPHQGPCVGMLRAIEQALHVRPLDDPLKPEGGLAILGMSLNAIGKGAADGLSEWGDPKAFGPLLEFIEDSSQNENARESACAALAWVATPENFLTIAEKIQQYEGQNPPDAFRRKCLLEALIQRPVPGTASALLTLLNRDQALETRNQVARAIAKSPKIYIFDDSFSALDYKTDLTLRRALREKINDATVIIVAQRISTILHADKIVVLNEGKIEGVGTHAELLKTCVTYQEIARSQLSSEELGEEA